MDGELITPFGTLNPVNVSSNSSICDFLANSFDNNQQKAYKLFSLNFRGLLSKKEAFANIIDNEVPHFIAGTESWLKPTVYSSEFFPPVYEIFRNDRPNGYGGFR